MPRSLADGHTKFTACTTKPSDPSAPTAAELNAGIDASDRVLASDFLWGATDSDKVAEKALADIANVNALGASNFQAAITAFRYFDATTGAADPTGDVVYAACKTKGTELWCYARRTGKVATGTWESSDEVFFGAHVITDTPQPPTDLSGYIKTRIVMEVQDGYPDITVG